MQLSWYVGRATCGVGDDPEDDEPAGERRYRPWYAERFPGIEEAAELLARRATRELREKTARFSDCFYDTTLPPEVVEAVAANLTILKSPTVLRQADGRLWGWEGCGDSWGCCHGSCTHVWNYAQAVPHLFPVARADAARDGVPASRRTRAGTRPSAPRCPSGPPVHDFHAAADGQLGGIMKVYREWRISGDTAWLRSLWPSVQTSLDYCIETWDPRHTGVARGAAPQHLRHRVLGPGRHVHELLPRRAAGRGRSWAQALGDDVPLYAELLEKGRRAHGDGPLERRVLRPEGPVEGPAGREPAGHEEHGRRATRRRPARCSRRRAPSTSTATGCLSDGVLGAWMAAVCGVGEVLDREKVDEPPARGPPLQPASTTSPTTPTRSGRPTPAATEGGLLLCTWPRGGALALPFVYSNEVWTGIEYQVASHLMLHGHGRGGPRDRPRLPRPLRRPRPQPLRRVRVRPLVRAGHVLVRPASRA